MYRTAEMQPGVANSLIKIRTFQRPPEHPKFAEIDRAKSAVAELKEATGHNESDSEFLKSFSARNCDGLSSAKSSISAPRPRAQNCHCESLISSRASVAFRAFPHEGLVAMPLLLCGGRRGHFYLAKEARSGELTDGNEPESHPLSGLAVSRGW
jgi:hypothetical protein